MGLLTLISAFCFKNAFCILQLTDGVDFNFQDEYCAAGKGIDRKHFECGESVEMFSVFQREKTNNILLFFTLLFHMLIEMFEW